MLCCAIQIQPHPMLMGLYPATLLQEEVPFRDFYMHKEHANCYSFFNSIACPSNHEHHEPTSPFSFVLSIIPQGTHGESTPENAVCSCA